MVLTKYNLDRGAAAFVLAAGAILVGVMILSCVLYFANETRWTRRVLFFPVFGTIDLDGEERFFPRQDTLEADIELTVQELILGPKEPEHIRVLPSDVRIDSIMYRDGTLYCNLSKEMLTNDTASPYNLEEMVQAVGNSILFNFPRLKHVHLFVNGQIPDSLLLQEDGIRFAGAMLR